MAWADGRRQAWERVLVARAAELLASVPNSERNHSFRQSSYEFRFRDCGGSRGGGDAERRVRIGGAPRSFTVAPLAHITFRGVSGNRHARFVLVADKVAGAPAPAWPGFLRSVVRRSAPAESRLARNPQASFVQRASASE